jgi:hypothetical protein
MWVFSLTEAHKICKLRGHRFPLDSALVVLRRVNGNLSSEGRKFLNSRSRATTRQNPSKR